MDGEKQRQTDTNVETHRRYTDREKAEGTPAPSHSIYKKTLGYQASRVDLNTTEEWHELGCACWVRRGGRKEMEGKERKKNRGK